MSVRNHRSYFNAPLSVYIVWYVLLACFPVVSFKHLCWSVWRRPGLVGHCRLLFLGWWSTAAWWIVRPWPLVLIGGSCAYLWRYTGWQEGHPLALPFSSLPVWAGCLRSVCLIRQETEFPLCVCVCVCVCAVWPKFVSKMHETDAWQACFLILLVWTILALTIYLSI